MINQQQVGKNISWINKMIWDEVEMCRATKIVQKPSNQSLPSQPEVVTTRQKRSLDQAQIASNFTLEQTLPEAATQLSP